VLTDLGAEGGHNNGQVSTRGSNRESLAGVWFFKLSASVYYNTS